MAARQKWAGGRVRTKMGRREDLGGLLVRSEWEAQVLRWLTKQGIVWTYEPYAFHFPVKRGVRVYTPDILLADGRLIEVKGYMKDQDRIKIKRMKIHHPKDFARLRYITKNQKAQATRMFEELGVPYFAYYDDILRELKSDVK